MTTEEVKTKISRYNELVAIRKEVEAGTRKFAHDGELMLLLEENALREELWAYFTRKRKDLLQEEAEAQGLVWV